MTPEHKKKLLAGRKASQEKKGKQIILINAKWRIERVDDYNWAIIHEVKRDKEGPAFEQWFYGRLLDALLAIPHRILNTAQLASLADILKSIKETAEDINRLRFTKFEALGDNI